MDKLSWSQEIIMNCNLIALSQLQWWLSKVRAYDDNYIPQKIMDVITYSWSILKHIIWEKQMVHGHSTTPASVFLDLGVFDNVIIIKRRWYFFQKYGSYFCLWVCVIYLSCKLFCINSKEMWLHERDSDVPAHGVNLVANCGSTL